MLTLHWYQTHNINAVIALIAESLYENGPGQDPKRPTEMSKMAHGLKRPINHATLYIIRLGPGLEAAVNT